MSQQSEYYEYICQIMLTTRSCRFNAAATLSTKDRWSVATVAIMSAYMLGWSLITVVYPEHISPENSKFFGTVSALASLALIVITLMDYSFDRPLRSQKLRKNALHITELMRELERELASPTPNTAVMDRIAADYERENVETEISHSATEMRRYRYSRSHSQNRYLMIAFKARHFAFMGVYYFAHMFAYISLITTLILCTATYSYLHVRLS